MSHWHNVVFKRCQRSIWFKQVYLAWCKSAKHVTNAVDIRMFSEGPFITEDNNRWFYLRGKSGRVYFSVAFACSIIFSWRLVFIMQIHASPNRQGVPVRLWEIPPKRDDAVNIVERYSDRTWQTSPPYESDFPAYVKHHQCQKVEKCPEK